MFSKIQLGTLGGSAFLGALYSPILAQSPANIPPCVASCAETAAASIGCTGSTAIPCICYSFSYNQLASACITLQCSFQDQQQAVVAYNEVCYPYTALTTSGPSQTIAPDNPLSGAEQNSDPVTLTFTATFESATSTIVTVISPSAEPSTTGSSNQPSDQGSLDPPNPSTSSVADLNALTAQVTIITGGSRTPLNPNRCLRLFRITSGAFEPQGLRKSG